MQPKYRVIFKNRETGENHKVGNLWPSQFDDVLNFNPIVEPNEQFNEMAFSEALEKWEKKEGFFNAYLNKPKEEAKKAGGKKRKGRDEDGLDDFA